MTETPANKSAAVPNRSASLSLQVREQQGWVVTVSLAILAVLALAFMLYYTRTVLVPFVVAIFIGAMASPLMDLMELRYRMSHTSAIVIALLVVAVLSVIFGLLLLQCIQKVVDESERMSHEFEALYDNIAGMIPWNDDNGPIPPRSTNSANRFPAGASAANMTDMADTEPLSKANPDSADQSPAEKRAMLPTDQRPSRGRMREFLSSRSMVFATRLAGSAMSIISGGMLTLIFAMFVLAGRRPHVVRTGVYAEIDSQIRAYIGTKVALSN